MHWVTSVNYVSGYKLRLGFNDGSVRVVDLAGHLDGEMFEPLKNQHLFRTAKLNPDLDTVVWDNGADMAPEFLYEIGVPDEQAANRLLKKACWPKKLCKFPNVFGGQFSVLGVFQHPAKVAEAPAKYGRKQPKASRDQTSTR